MKSLNWGLVGGGKGSQIGDAHRIGAAMDGCFKLVAGALDIDPKKGRKFATECGIEKDRAYADWREMLNAESTREDGIELVTVATPNSTHYEITEAFLNAGMHVLCEKPLTMTSSEALRLQRLARRKKLILGVNFGYTGYPMIRQARAMVQSGKLGKIRLVFAQFAHGHHSDASDKDNPRVRWRYDPKQAGSSSVLADCGIHALQMASFVLGQKASRLSADFLSSVKGRKLEDDAALQIEMSGGTACRLWTSAIALGHLHGLSLEIFGETGALRWHQEQPNQLYYTPLNKPTQILERGGPGMHADTKASTRVAIAHPEGMLEAFANIYTDFHAAMAGNQKALDRLPVAEYGVDMVKVVETAVKSAHAKGRWTKVS